MNAIDLLRDRPALPCGNVLGKDIVARRHSTQTKAFHCTGFSYQVLQANDFLELPP